MATLEELKEEKRKLEAQKEVRESYAKRDYEKKQLKRDIRHLKYGHISEGISSAGRTTYSGFKSVGKSLAPVGKQVVSYGQYLAGPAKSEQPKHLKKEYKHIYIKRGKHYVRKKVRVKKEYRPDKQKQQSGYEGSTSLRPSSEWGW